MGFEHIYEAAKKQDATLLKDAIGLGCIDEMKTGTFDHTASYQLALEKNTAAAEFLIKHGANIKWVARSAGVGGHREYAEELIQRGADIDSVARGAGMGGHQEYADDLIRRGADINCVAQGASVGGHREYAEDLIRRGADIDWVAQGASVGGHREYAEDLIRRGADIDWVVQGAGIGRHREYAEELIQRGADIKWVAQGAGVGGHREYADDLIRRGADIDWVACGAGVGGHQEYAEELIRRGADIDWVARGAGIGGHREYAEELIRCGADIDWVAQGASIGRQMINRVDTQIAYLSFYSADVIPKLVDAFKKLDKPIFITAETEKRAIAISNHMVKAKLSFPQALTRTDPNCRGMLYLLMMFVMHNENISALSQNDIPFVPPEIWLHIFNFITPVTLDQKERETLGFVVGRSYLCAQLSSYASSWGRHKERAFSFFQAVSATHHKEDMQALVSKQVQVLQGNNVYPLLERDAKYKTNIQNATVDKYHGIVGFWEKKLTGRDVVCEGEPSSRASQCLMQ